MDTMNEVRFPSTNPNLFNLIFLQLLLVSYTVLEIGKKYKKKFSPFFLNQKASFQWGSLLLKMQQRLGTRARNHVPTEGRRGNRIPCHATNLKDIYVVKYPTNGKNNMKWKAW